MSGVKELFQSEGGKVATWSVGHGVGGFMGCYVGLTIIGGAIGVLPILAGAAAFVGGLYITGHCIIARKRSKVEAAGKSFRTQEWTGFVVGMVAGAALVSMVNVLVTPKADNAPSQRTAITAISEGKCYDLTIEGSKTISASGLVSYPKVVSARPLGCNL